MKTLLTHQIEDSKFLASRAFAGCFSGMGSGKTLTALAACREVQALSVLIIAPPIALDMWAEEAASELGYETQILKSGSTKIKAGVNVLICSYQIATSRKDELYHWLADSSKSALICDESHALKSHTAKRTKAVLGSGGIASGAHHAWMLTGTPVTRWNDDLFPFLCRADMPGLKHRIGGNTIERFQLQYTIGQNRRFGGMYKPKRVTVGNRNTDALNQWLYQGQERIAVRRELKDVWGAMPPLTVNTYTIKATRSPAYDEVVRKLDGMTMTQVVDSLARYQEQEEGETSMPTMRRLIGLAKVEAAAEYLVERVADTQGAVLVGAWHTQVIDSMVERLQTKKLRVASLDGRTPAAKKTQLQAAFNAGDLDVLVGQIAAMGVSLNLQRGGNCIVTVEEDWSPAVMDQFYARLHRMGQEKHVHVDKLIVANKLDRAVARLASKKAAEHRKLNAQHGVD
jgi:SNF2 family DNA or RNA helicase